MSSSDYEDLKKLIEKSHMSQSEVVSKLFNETRKDIKTIRESLFEMRRDLSQALREIDKLDVALGRFEEEYRKNVASNVNTWNAAADSQKWAVRIVIGLVMASLLAVIGLK